MIKREDFNGKRYEEMQQAMQAELVTYSEMVSAFTTIDECNAEEQVLMASMDEVENRLKDVLYKLPEEAEYDGKVYSKKEITSKIVYFLNKLEVKWENTLGLYQLVKLWKNETTEEIGYHPYDSTLRCLNQVPFKGFQEWNDILAINEYISKCHNEYSLDTGMIVFLSECHNVLMNKMKELQPTSDIPEDMKA